jgi:hypothetical protein
MHNLGDHLKEMVLLLAVLYLAALSLAGMSAGADASANQIINSYEGNLSQKEVRSLDMLSFFGRSGFFIAEAVKFKAPNPGWKLNSVKLVAWDGFNGTVESIPSSREIGLEVRDKDLNLLYKFADSQLPYSNYAQNATLGYPMTIEVPSIPVSDDFYICFYDRGAVAIAFEPLNETSSNSFLYIQPGNLLQPADLPLGENKTLPVNWIMSVTGK